MEPIFWRDYFQTLGKAISKLKEILQDKNLETIDYMREATIQRFEFVIELYWKLLKKILSYEKVESSSPRDVMRKAFQYNLIDDEAIWLAMLDDRNDTSHLYDEQRSKIIFNNIKGYSPILERTYQKLRTQYKL